MLVDMYGDLEKCERIIVVCEYCGSVVDMYRVLEKCGSVIVICK